MNPRRRGAVIRIVVAVGLLISLFLATGQSPRVDSNAQAEEEVKALSLKLADLVVHAKWDEYEQHLAPEYLHTGYNGQVENKDVALSTLRDERRKIIVMEVEPADELVRIYGDVALFNAEFSISVRESGQLKSRRIRLTDIFVRRDGKWLLAAEHASTIGK